MSTPLSGDTLMSWMSGVTTADPSETLSRLHKHFDRIKHNCFGAYARYLPPKLVASYAEQLDGLHLSIVSQATASRSGLLYPYSTHSLLSTSPDLAHRAPTFSNRPVNRPWNYEYRRKQTLDEVSTVGLTPIFPHTPYINLQDVFTKLQLFAADFVGGMRLHCFL